MEDRIDEMKKQKQKQQQQQKKKKQPTRPAPAASIAGPCPTICQSSRTPRHWKLPSTIARPNHPQSDRECISICIHWNLFEMFQRGWK